MIIIQDTREQQPWNFNSYNECSAQICDTLKTGDYAIQKYPSLIILERKKSVGELANNLGKHYDRFVRELERMQEYTHRYVICEFSYEKLLMFPKGTNLPRRVRSKIRMSGKFLAKRVNELMTCYETEFIFCKDKFEAQDKAMELLIDAYGQKQTDKL